MKDNSLIISVIVPVYEQWDLIKLLVTSLAKQTFDQNKWELIIVDNGSKNIPDVEMAIVNTCVCVCTEKGSYAARNHGIENARGQLLVFTDADCQPDCNWLETIFQHYLSNGENALYAGSVKVSPLHSNKPNMYEVYDSYLGIPQQSYVKRGYAVTANLAVPSIVFAEVGVFDGKRFSGGDAEFCQRAVSKGKSLLYVQSAMVLHPARSEWVQLETKARRMKGGQMLNGPFKRRAYFFLKTFVDPFIGLFRIFKSELGAKEKCIVSFVVFRLWFVNLKEIVSLLLGAQPERR